MIRLDDQKLKNTVRILASKHTEFRHVYELYGTPPLWDRPP